jgi:hypothetical protein
MPYSHSNPELPKWQIISTKMAEWIVNRPRNSFSSRTVERSPNLSTSYLSIFTIHMLKITENGANLAMSAHA